MTTATKTSEKLDLYRKYGKEYAASRKPALLKTGRATYLSVRGKGAPGGEEFAAAIGALYGIAFTVKMTRKFSGKQDYVVAKLEALWPNIKEGDPVLPKEQWTWQLLIRTPDFVKPAELAQAVAVLNKRGKGAGADRVRLESLEEGTCVQMLHVGPYDEECKTIGTMKAFAEEKGMKFCAAHHEIYLSDPRRVAPAKLRTILRQPVEPL